MWIAAIMLTGAGATLQAGIASSPAVVSFEDKADPARQVCKREARTGTRFTSTTCKSAAEWERMREQHMRDAKEMIDRPVIETRRGN